MAAQSSGSSTRVCLVHSQTLLEMAEKNPRFAGRGRLVHFLIEAYGLLDKLRKGQSHVDRLIILVVEPQPVGRRELAAFHSPAYLQFLESHGHRSGGGGEEEEEEEEEDLLLNGPMAEGMEEFGLGYDCPLFDGIFDYVCAVAGASLAGAEALVRGESSTVINWYGGWHHGKKDEASGFCYCNDIVLAILKLLECYQRVLYVDMDIHHGDGVEEAFFHSSRVVTMSLHKLSPGFFPGTGGVDSVGVGRGRFHTVNVPLSDGMRDEQFEEIFRRVTGDVRERFRPQVVVLQCGADMLSGDPVGSFCLTPRGVGRCVNIVLQWGLPTLLLGGGGYHFANTARLWAYCTSLAVKEELSNEIPEHEYFDRYGPEYELHFSPSNRRNENSQKTVSELMQTISGHLSNLESST